jgi:hypothetical protein
MIEIAPLRGTDFSTAPSQMEINPFPNAGLLRQSPEDVLQTAWRIAPLNAAFQKFIQSKKQETQKSPKA